MLDGLQAEAPTRARAWPDLHRRRLGFGLLVGMSIIASTGLLVAIVCAKGRFDAADAMLSAVFVINVTWVALGFWNAAVGLILRHAPGRRVDLSADSPAGGIAAKVAVAMTIRDESTAGVFARLRAMKDSLDALGCGDAFDYFVLSDSSNADVAAQEERAVAAWQAELPRPAQITYRRRDTNDGFKPGNLRDFCRRWGGDYDFLVLLDADSLMTGETIVRLVDAMARHPALGILQTLIVGILTPSFFARVFEFGHRHGLRCMLAGAAWWQGDRCQYWGHNAVIRLQPFIKHCEMPYLPGKGPFSGHIICHDQIEASLMHRAGWEVRVLAAESGSYEGVPPTLFDFMARNHRWCQGNLKNLKVIGAAGLPAIDRFHLGVVAQRFLAWPALVAFVLLAAVQASSWPADVAFPVRAALLLYGIWLAMFVFPKIAGIADAWVTAPSRYGGRARLVLGGLTELAFTLLLTPVSVVAATEFVVGLMFGRKLAWDRQARDGYRLSWGRALAGLWLQTALGVGLAAGLAWLSPASLVWFAPFWLGLVLAVPFATLTTSPAVDAWAKRVGLCRIPEEVDMPAEIGAFLRLSAGCAP